MLASCFIAPIVNWWISILVRLKLSTLPATLVDQFLFSPPFTVAIFYFISAVFKGGLSLTAGWSGAERLEVNAALDLGKFPTILNFEPIWATQVQAYGLWLPATLVREAFIPSHLKQPFTSGVGFVWNVFLAFILAAK